MSAETNLITKATLRATNAQIREQEFALMFEDDLRKLIEALGVTRKIAKQAGYKLKTYKATGTLASGAVAEGETIPLSAYSVTKVDWADLTLKKWRKATSAEAIVEYGYDQAVTMTTDKMAKDIAKGIRTDFFTQLSNGTGVATGNSFQKVLANAWGQLQVLFEDTDSTPVYFVNPLDVADYLANATITTQQAFGMSYVEDFLGLGTVFMNSSVPQGTVYATARENVVLYYIPVNGADLGEAFNFSADATGYIGIHEEPDYNNMTASDTAISGLTFFAEKLDGIVIGTIA